MGTLLKAMREGPKVKRVVLLLRAAEALRERAVLCLSCNVSVDKRKTGIGGRKDKKTKETRNCQDILYRL